MEKASVNILELQGTNYEIGFKLGKAVLESGQISNVKSSPDIFTKEEIKEMVDLFDEFLPGMNEEIKGFSDAIGLTELEVFYYALTYLVPGCSIIAILPELSNNDHVMVARNYEFSHKMEDFTFSKTQVKGKYAHMGGSVMIFGRSEGINEKGLMVGQTSCGMPVGNMDMLRKPAIKGLQFWAVIRSLLENCKDCDEALNMVLKMPIAYNINLMLADKSGKAVLFETLDGVKSYEVIDSTTKKQYLHCTNHPHLEDIIDIEPYGMEHSVTRYSYIENNLESKSNISKDDLKEMLLSEYPNGLSCHWYEEFFGTIKSMVFDVNQCKVDICWGGNEKNGWTSYSFDRELSEEVLLMDIDVKHPDFDFTRIINLKE